MKIKVAEYAGYCYGVERALKMASQAANHNQAPKPIFSLGPIIHNPQVVQSLENKGVHHISHLGEIKQGTIIIRSHGMAPKIIAEAKKKGIQVIDATCPFVKKAQHCASKLISEGYRLIIVGEQAHPEVIGILAHAGDNAMVVEKASDLQFLTEGERVGVVVQTTQQVENLKKIVSELLPKVVELKVFNTICDATTKRQTAIRELARKVNVMMVVGGRNSANTNRLAQICQELGTVTHHIETASEIDPAWFNKNSIVGITAGASTPDWILEEVVERLKRIDRELGAGDARVSQGGC